MKVAYSLAEAEIDGNSVVTIGNFDGLHKGHSAILERARNHAQTLGTTSVAITFNPHPVRVLAPDRAPPLISTLNQRIQLIAATGIDLLLVQEFNSDFSKLSPEEFVQNYLINHFQSEAVCVGKNFRFGHRHAGNVDKLDEWQESYEVIAVPAVEASGGFVSSSRIRTALSAGDLRSARKMLGRCYEIEGNVVSGTGRGKNETVPTINIDSLNDLILRDGVYVTRIELDGQSSFKAVTNIGTCPTFAGKKRTIETHVLDTSISFNTKFARLRFLNRLRDEKQFPDALVLMAQIQEDTEHARKFFRRYPKNKDPNQRTLILQSNDE